VIFHGNTILDQRVLHLVIERAVHGLFLKGQGREELTVIEQKIKGLRPLESITSNS